MVRSRSCPWCQTSLPLSDSSLWSMICAFFVRVHSDCSGSVTEPGVHTTRCRPVHRSQDFGRASEDQLNHSANLLLIVPHFAWLPLSHSLLLGAF